MRPSSMPLGEFAEITTIGKHKYYDSPNLRVYFYLVKQKISCHYQKNPCYLVIKVVKQQKFR